MRVVHEAQIESMSNLKEQKQAEAIQTKFQELIS